MILARALRVLAWAIAIAAFVDPVITSERDRRVPVSVITMRTASLDLPMADGATRGQAVARAVAALESRLGEGYRVQQRDLAPGMPDDCAGAEACVWAGDDSAAPVRTSVSVPQFALVAADALSPNIAVRGVSAASTQHAGALGRMRVTLDGAGVGGARIDVRVLDGRREAGVATTEWREGQTTADVDVEWWPVEEGLRRLTVEAVAVEGEASELDNRMTLAVQVVRARLPVLVYEPRPSWATTFVRRALEADPRLTVQARSRVSPRISVTTEAAPTLTPAALNDVALVVVGGLEALGDAETALLRAYVERRGGALLVLPDMVPSGPAVRLVPGALRERLVGQPERAGALHATEWAITTAPDPVDRVLASLDSGAAAIVESPLGRGRIVVSGAMDAWRYRGDGDAFDRFWQGLAARLAAGTGAVLDVQPQAARVAVGATTSLEVAWRSLLTPDGEWPAVEAWLTCDGQGQTPLTAWPMAQPGRYRVEVGAEMPGICTVEVAAAGGDAVAPAARVEVVEGPGAGASTDPGGLSRVARARGGAAFGVAETAALAAALVDAVPPRREPHEMHPLRSGWWMLALAGALGGEWWLRRRHGLR
ncbi:MAG: hypothetical protein Q8L86_10875 [Vicinamibacterales bacterium]|nr:hypothetical protein [Vicinamibacterales bacterium]